MRRVSRRLRQKHPSSRGRLVLFLAGGLVTAVLLVIILISLEHRSPVQSALPDPPIVAAPKRAAPAPPSTVSTPHDTPDATSPETFTFYDTLEQQSSPPPGLIDPLSKPALRSPPPSAPPPRLEAASPKKQRSLYTIQIAAIKDRSAAEALSDRLKRKGYPVFILPHIVPKQGTWYRVRVGHFTKRAAAQDMAQRLAKQERLTTYIALE